jgi:hypothetical protein
VPLFQVPPETPEVVKEILDPTHTDVGPLIFPAFGREFMVNETDATVVPQLFVTE